MLISIDYEQYFINLIMDFIRNHSSVFAVVAASAITAFLGIGMYLHFKYRLYSRKNQGKELVQVKYTQSNVQIFKQQFSQEVQFLRQSIKDRSLSLEEINYLSQLFANYIVSRTEDIEKQNYCKAVQWKLKNSFQTYLNLLLDNQKNNETLNASFKEEQEQIFITLKLSPEEKIIVKEKIQSILQQRIHAAVTDDIINETRIILSAKNQFLKVYGQKLAEDILKNKNWTQENEKYIPDILNVIINEQTYSKHHESIPHTIEIIWAIQTHEKVFEKQLKIWQQSINPIYRKISSELANK